MEGTSEMSFGAEKRPQKFEDVFGRIHFNTDIAAIQQYLSEPATPESGYRILAQKYCQTPKYITRFEMTLDKPETVNDKPVSETELGASIYFNSGMLGRPDKGFYDEARRNALGRAFIQRGFEIEQYSLKTGTEGIETHGIRLQRGQMQYDLQLGYESAEIMIKKAEQKLQAGRLSPRNARKYESEQFYNSSIRMLSTPLLETQIDNEHLSHTMQAYTEDTKDLLVAVYLELGEELDEDISMTLR